MSASTPHNTTFLREAFATEQTCLIANLESSQRITHPGDRGEVNEQHFIDFLRSYLLGHRAEIEAAYGHSLDWRRLDDYKVAVVMHAAAFEGYDKANWPAMIGWLVAHIPALERAFKPHISSLRQLLRTQFPRSALPIDSPAESSEIA